MDPNPTDPNAAAGPAGEPAVPIETTGQRLSRERGEDYFPELQLTLAVGRKMRVGHAAEMRLRLVNRGDRALRDIELEFHNKDAALLRHDEIRKLRELRPGDAIDRINSVSLEPQRPGERKIEIRARLGDGGNGQPLALETFIVLRIEEPDEKGDRHYHLAIDGPPVDVKKSVGGGMEGNRIVGSDERVIVDNRQEIHLHEAGDARRDDDSGLIQREAQFWLDYEGTQDLLRKRQQALPATSRFRWVEQAPSKAGTSSEAAGDDADKSSKPRALRNAWVLDASASNAAGSATWHHRYVLIMRPTLKVGRSRENDYILRFAPYGDKRSDQASASISRHLGQFEFKEGRLAWQYDGEGAGEPHLLDEEAPIDLVRGMTVRYRADHMAGETNAELNDLAREMQRLEPHLTLAGSPTSTPPAADFGLKAGHDVLSATLVRQSDPCGETLIWTPRLVRLGLSPRNAIRVLADEVEPIHARLIYHQGNLALENQSAAAATWIEDRKLERGELALLQPGNVIKIGKARLVLKPYDPAEYLDRCKQELSDKQPRGV